MAHAHDRTLLASLAFGDPDKKDPLHDLACQYIAQSDVCDAIGLKRGDHHFVFDKTKRAMLEHPISKGQGQYKTTIGFLDVVLPLRYMDNNDDDDGANYISANWKDGYCCIVEVKIASQGLGDILRQINLYREYFNQPVAFTVLAAAFPMSVAMVDGLCANNITPVQLGEGFRKWAAEQRNAPPAVGVVSL